MFRLTIKNFDSHQSCIEIRFKTIPSWLRIIHVNVTSIRIVWDTVKLHIKKTRCAEDSIKFRWFDAFRIHQRVLVNEVPPRFFGGREGGKFINCFGKRSKCFDLTCLSVFEFNYMGTSCSVATSKYKDDSTFLGGNTKILTATAISVSISSCTHIMINDIFLLNINYYYQCHANRIN